MPEKDLQKKEGSMNDFLTESQRRLMTCLMTERAPEIIERCIQKPLEKISEVDLDVLVYQIGRPTNRTEAELKGYLFAVYDSKMEAPEGKNPHLSETQQVLVHQLREREPERFKEHFGKPEGRITKADVEDVCGRLGRRLRRDGKELGIAVLRGYLLAIQDANFELTKTGKMGSEVREKSRKMKPEGLMDTSMEESMNDFAMYDTSVDEMEWTDLQILPYVTDSRTSVYEIEPANRTLIAEDEASDRGLTILKNLQVEHFHSILNAIRKDPVKYIDLKTGEFVSRKLAKLTVAVLNDIRAIDPDFEESIKIPGYKLLKSAELYISAKRCLKKESRGR